jgi:hypothetical protein
MNSDEQAFERLRLWQEKVVPLVFSFTGPPHNFSIEVDVKGVGEKSISFRWHLYAVDPNGPPKPFITTDGYFVVWLEGTTLSVSDDPNPSVLISRGPFTCTLTALRPFA